MNEFKVVVCPDCGKENHINAESMVEDAACEFCHTQLQPGLEQPVASPPAPPKYIDPKTLPFSTIRPFWYVALMTIVTFGLYLIVWFYRGWKVLLKQYQLKGGALLNTIFYPLCLWSFYRYAFSFGEQGGYKSSWQANGAASLFFTFHAICNISARISNTKSLNLPPFESCILDILSVIMVFLMLIPLKEGVNAMNAGYSVIQPGTRIRTSLSPLSITFLVIGSILWIFVVIGTIAMLSGAAIPE
jgi:hypothetical protein